MSGLDSTTMMPAARSSAIDICEALVWLRREAELAGLMRLATSIGESIATGTDEGGACADEP